MAVFSAGAGETLIKQKKYEFENRMADEINVLNAPHLSGVQRCRPVFIPLF